MSPLSLLGWARSAFQALLALVIRYPFQMACVGLILACGWMWNAKDNAERDRDEAVAAYRATVKRYLTAQAEAEAAEKARLTRVRAEQERISADVATDYSQRLADLRTRYDRMRRQGNGSAADRVAVPGVPQTAGRANDAADDQGFSINARLIASEQAEQLVALQDWVRQQGAVE